MNQQTTVRARAIATQDAAIQRNVAQIEENKARPTAIQAMAQRLNLTPAKLQETLRQTVFREANDAEFAALVVVANEYKLNPLLKEIFAFKAKGGGIIPYVSVDGWIRIINEHPQFDGIEFNDIVDEKGELYAIESVIWRRDRSRPIKVTEYLDECRRDTEPWKKSPKRFLRHRALMQGGRVAFGFSGIGPEDDYEVVGYAPQPSQDMRDVTLPSRRDMVPHDPNTGEILDEETARELDREGLRQMDGQSDDSEEGPATEQRGEAHEGAADRIITEIELRTTVPDINSYMAGQKDVIISLSDADRERIAIAQDAAVAAIKGGKS
jgi:phage recombination protein Bet